MVDPVQHPPLDDLIPDPDGGHGDRYAARLLAVATAAFERRSDAPLDDGSAVAAAIDAGGDLEHRVLVRAGRLPDAAALTTALNTARVTTGLIVAALVVGSAVSGVLAAAAALAGEPDRPLNVFWLLGGVLGVQTLLLVAWIALTLFGPSALARYSLGGAVWVVLRRILNRLGRGARSSAATEAVVSTTTRGPIGRWSLGALSNGLWTSFNVGCLLMTLVLLSVRQREFCWESTILDADTYATATEAVAWWPHRLGFAAPNGEEIRGSRFDPARPDAFGVQTDETRAAWASLLVGAVLAYGLLPRATLTVLSVFLLRRARRRFRLDVGRAPFSLLRSRLEPARASLGIVDADPGPHRERDEPTASRAHRAPTGPPALLGLEIAPPAGGWPPPAEGPVTDLGIVASREECHDALERLAAPSEAPSRLLVVCSLRTVPDRGVLRFLGEAVHAAGSETVAILSGGAALRARTDADGVRQRVADWRDGAARAGVVAVHEIDLDHLTGATSARLAAILGGRDPDAGAGPVRHLEAACDLIVSACDAWTGAPSIAQRAELHREILRLHGAEAGATTAFRRLVGLTDRVDVDVRAALESPQATVRAAADRVLELMPPRLRALPAWAAAGAATGAIGCVAAATLVFPGAIAALPMWSAIGAGVSAAVPATRALRREPEEARASAASGPEDELDRFGDAVRAAAMTAVLLDHQGTGEARMAMLLDRVAGPESDPVPIASATAARAFLDDVRHRVDLALAAEDSG